MPVTMRGGKEYRTVVERLKVAHGEDALPVGIREIRTSIQSAGAGAHVVVLAVVVFGDGREFTGMSLARFDATTGADATSPIECAETSAVGRALAFAGYYGSDDGLAGAEELRDAQRFGPVRKPGVATNGAARVDEDLGRGSAAPRPVQRANPQDGPAYDESGAFPPAGYDGGAGSASPPATEKQLQSIARMARALGREVATEGLTRYAASTLISDMGEEMSRQRSAP